MIMLRQASLKTFEELNEFRGEVLNRRLCFWFRLAIICRMLFWDELFFGEFFCFGDVLFIVRILAGRVVKLHSFSFVMCQFPKMSRMKQALILDIRFWQNTTFSSICFNPSITSFRTFVRGLTLIVSCTLFSPRKKHCLSSTTKDCRFSIASS